MPRIRIAALLALLALSAGLAPTPSAAQTRAIEPGDEVRVLAPRLAPGRMQGLVVSYDSSGLVLREPGTRAVREIPLSQIREMARNEGLDRRRAAWRWARIGGWTGLAAGGVSGPLIASGQGGEGLAVAGALAAGGGMLLGAAVGGLAGAAFAGEHWQEFRIPRPERLTVSRGAQGTVVLGLALPVRW